MPRNGSGTYSLPQAAFVPGTTISSSAMNSDLSDIAAQLTNSVAADGQTSMTGALKATGGSAAAPAYTFGSSLTDGIFLSGTHQLGVAISGLLAATFTSAGLASATGIPNTTPVGTVVDYAGSSAPTGWLLLFGQAVSRTTYALLFATIGTTYGVGDGSTTFNLPDCRGRAAFGDDNMGGSAANRITVAGGNFDGTILGNTGGAQNETLTSAQIPASGYTFTGTQQTWNLTQGSMADTVAFSVTTGAGASVGATAAAQHTVTVTPAGSVTVSGGGNSHPQMPPAIIFNKIIFAGA